MATTRETFHVLDLPQLYRKPPAPDLLSALSALAITPPTFEIADSPPSINEDGVAAYLTRIISSPLAWITSDIDKEHIWTAASKRLSERSGRTAIPSSERTFTIPLPDAVSSRRVDGAKELTVRLYEPTLTGDNLGHKTWVASYLLAKLLPSLLLTHCPWIHDTRPRILELGAGTGLVGLAASGMFVADIMLTDLEAILGNLRHNVEKNASLAVGEKNGMQGMVQVSVLDWSIPAAPPNPPTPTIILAADPLYAPPHARWLTTTISTHLAPSTESRVFICLPLRPGSPFIAGFYSEMGGQGLEAVEGGEEVGVDDWGRVEGGERERVVCEWSVWRWKEGRGD